MAPIKSLVLLGLAAGCALVNGQWAAQRMRPYRDPSGCSEVERVDPNSACFNGGAAPLSPSGQGEAMPVNKVRRDRRAAGTLG